MKITCQSCQSKYNVADEKVQGKIVKIRCRKCGATIVVQGNGGASANGGASTGTAGAIGGLDADGVQWHVNVGDAEPRTMSLADLVEAYNAGTIAQDTFIWTDGMDDWKPLSEVEAVVSALHAGGAPSKVATQGSPYEGESADEVTQAVPSPLAAMAAAAAEPAPEPKRAAVKREATRARDLFGSGGGGEEVQTSAPAVPRMMNAAAAAAVDDSSKLTGERNENSVLFSLAVLTKEGGDRAEEPAPRPTSKNNEDSGLIDLKALAAKAESMRPAAMADANVFSSPLGLGGPSLGAPVGVLGSPLGEAPQKSKLPLYIGGGAGVFLLLVLGIVIGVKVAGPGASPEAATTIASTAPTASAAPTVEPTAPSATAAPEASASAAPSASVAAKPKAAPAQVYHAPTAPKPAGNTGATGTPTAAAATPPPPKKAGSDCGCNGDLMCLMKCSTH
jgi:predicted Zn finger-like uncharacterized protein